jgi:hypothetical protein
VEYSGIACVGYFAEEICLIPWIRFLVFSSLVSILSFVRQTQARHGASPRSRDESTKYDSAH